MLELLLLAVPIFVAAFRSRRDIALENLVLRHQLQVALGTNPHPRLRTQDRVLWVGFAVSRLEVGDSTFVSCSLRQSSGGIGRDGDSIGLGSRGPGSVGPG